MLISRIYKFLASVFFLVFSIALHVPITFIDAFLDVCAWIISWLYVYLSTSNIHKEENHGRICPETNGYGNRTGQFLKKLFICMFWRGNSSYAPFGFLKWNFVFKATKKNWWKFSKIVAIYHRDTVFYFCWHSLFPESNHD